MTIKYSSLRHESAQWKASRPRPNVYVVARPVDSVTLTVAADGGRDTPSPSTVSYAPDTLIIIIKVSYLAQQKANYCFWSSATFATA